MTTTTRVAAAAVIGVIAIGIGVAVNSMLGPQCAMLPELFGNRHRYLGVAMAREISAVLAGASPCGRTSQRIKGWMGRADQTAKVKGMFVRPEQIAEIGKRHPELGRLRLVVTRAGETDAMTLRAECTSAADALQGEVAATLRAVTKLGGAVELVGAGSLPNDGKVIEDARSYK